MPPRGPPQSGGGGGRGRGRGGGAGTARGGGPSAPRGGGPSGPRGGGPPGLTRTAATNVGLPDMSPHITTIGVKRSAFGQSGRALNVFTNHFPVSIPQDNIHHYDGAWQSLYASSHVSERELCIQLVCTIPLVPLLVSLLSICTVISPSEKTLPARLNMEIIKRLQTVVAPQVFTPRAAYDGRKNMFAARELPFGPSGTQEVRLHALRHF